MSMIAWPGVSDPHGLGGKAAALMRLAAAGFNVPAFFVVKPSALALAMGLHAEDLPKLSEDEWRRRIELLTLTGTVERQIAESYARLCPEIGGYPVAIRSSAADEDSADHSFAGQLDTFLFVSRGQLPEKVVAVWRSNFSERILAYRRERGLALPRAGPAVIIQRMVAPDAAGVAFSADPVSGRRSVAVVSAVPGAGTALVSGEADADTFTVDRQGHILTRQIATKRVRHVMSPESAEGIASVPIEGALQTVPSLEDLHVQRIAALAREAAHHFRRPQDIEWALEAGVLYLLQSRPITSLAHVPDPEGTLQIWDNSNIAESYAGITTPLTFTFARHAYEGVYKQFCRLMNVPERVIADHHVMFANMLGLIRGRVYYNLLNWYRMLALLPGFAVNRGFMEQMMGVKEGLPEHLAQELSGVSLGAKIRDGLRLAGAMVGLMWNQVTLPGQIRRFYVRLNAAMAPPETPIEQMRADELAAYFRTLERQLLTRWDAPLVNDFFAMIFYGVLGKLAGRFMPGTNLHNDLLCAEGGIISTEPARRIREMAEVVAANPHLIDPLATGPRAAAEKAIESHPELAFAYDQYLDKFAHRCLEELKLESATLHDDPLPLIRSIAGMAQRIDGGMPADPNIEAKMRAEAESLAAEKLSGHPVKAMLFRWVLKNTRARVRDRENLRFERTRLFGRVRLIFVELGQRLAGEGVLADPRDVFYLTLEELLAFVEGTAVTTDLRHLAALRKKEFHHYRETPAPAERFETHGPVYLANKFQPARAPVAETSADADARRGIGCCPGVVRGPARVIIDPRGATILPGEILIATRTDPGWIMLFPAAAGVAVEFGSVLSHSAIVAREMGIPAVVSVPGLTTWVKTGDFLELDGKAGIVKKIPADAPAPPGAHAEASTA